MNKKIKFIERIKILKHFSKVNENTWLVQSNKNSLCEAFYVTVIPSGIIMTGDYGGVMLMPYGSKDLINWMANATDIGYFCQKVSMANQYHKVKDWEPERALEDIRKEFENDWENYREKLKYYKEFETLTANETRLIIEDKFYDFLKDECWNFEDLDLRKKNDIIDSLMHEISNKFDTEEEMYHFLSNYLDWEDVWECEYGRDYTHQIKWQHQCLLWWANNVVDDSNE